MFAPLGAAGGCEDPAGCYVGRELRAVAALEPVLGAVALVSVTQGTRATLFAADRTSDQRRWLSLLEKVKDLDARKTFVAISSN